MMAADTVALEAMQASGERSVKRLRDLVNHYAQYLGEDPQEQLQQALTRAPRVMPGFDRDEGSPVKTLRRGAGFVGSL